MNIFFLSFQNVNKCELYFVLIVILAIDVIVLTTWQIIDPMYRDTENFDLEPSPSTDQDIMLQPFLEHCNSKNISVWLGTYGLLSIEYIIREMSRPMGKPTICIGENKGADQLRSN